MDNINAVMESCTMQRETNTSISHRRHTKREMPFKSAYGRTSTKLIVRYKSHAPYCFGNMQGLNSMNDIQLISIILRWRAATCSSVVAVTQIKVERNLIISKAQKEIKHELSELSIYCLVFFL